MRCPAPRSHADEFGALLGRASGGDGDERLLAAVARDPVGAPLRLRSEAGNIRGRRRDDRGAQSRRQARPLGEPLAHARVVAEALQHPPQSALAEFDVDVADQRQHRAAFADVGERGGHGRAQRDAASDRGLRLRIAIADAIDEIGVAEQRRMGERCARDLGDVAGERQHDVARRRPRAGEGFRQSASDARLGIVEGADQPDLGLRACLGGEVAMEQGARQRVDGFGPLVRMGGRHPAQNAANQARLVRENLGVMGFGDGEGVHRSSRKLGLTLFSPLR